jgi:ribosome biogenesis GTPase
MLLDTPGMRELQLWADEEALDTTFPEVSELAAGCRFDDCAHHGEPGCAVLAAVGSGALPVERFDAWRKLQREIRALEVRRDARLRQEHKRQAKTMERNLRRHYGH